MLGLRSKGHGERIVVADWLELRKDGNRFTVVIRPGVYGPEHRSTLAAITALLDDAMPDVGLLDVLAQQEIDTICAQTAAGEYLQNPAVAVPDLVATAAARHAIDSGAATLYLQLLALPDPTDANVARWTGWPADRLKAARAALAETDLVRTAKRTRAGRSLFLPGGWTDVRRPRRPVETWKLALLATDRPGPLLPAGTVAGCFRAAWQRVEDGDAPTYKQL
ncbi:hypothetical protein GCM10009765_43540 [Fodinicola feengrottensis]|uniref:Uncharacterized protein n=1 Tax=Fodinicola feengrottensis TaxID=435914 RepID=A0ABP4TKD4_9ACTN